MPGLGEKSRSHESPWGGEGGLLLIRIDPSLTLPALTDVRFKALLPGPFQLHCLIEQERIFVRYLI
jgi:hypothetical protein